MKKNRKNKKIFIRSAFITAVVLICITAVFLGICESYEEIRRISFNESRPAIEFSHKKIRVLDFEINV